jgi:hypothetical protein
VEGSWRACTSAQKQRGASQTDGAGPSTRSQGENRRREYMDLVDPILGRELCINASKLGEVDLVHHHVVLTSALSGDHVLNRVSESILGLFGEAGA